MTERPEPLDLIWGVEAIARFIGRTVRQTEGALYAGDLPAKKINGRWCASASALREFFRGAA